ncbi:AAA family ATPase [Turicibacter sanguinis]|uniref:AAA family ATPase n=1 Tax=Turicibacter sanguinis TaxID=154288 RepID=UPI00232C25FC|nr:AAA family ATPase [Turicibacter sanguinis]MDB8575616.1 AAA family ATPase [Turicibacter sanguinis]MDB8578748.1 AAA family ATPase [Turicibacter sanguinis]MDB8584071.1 AAA family ATPase [Turicibacter sanguinis]MDB8588130.1 AAA family ATPase [Turicibacter sanguinis]MDB8598138.1 AAA family ATPase [Turicibacter sanguinis]
MQLKFENIGKVRQANIEINGITIVAGENNTGKSTVGKVLFCIFNSFFDVKNRILIERSSEVESLLLRIMSTLYSGRDMSQFIYRSMEEMIEFADELLENKVVYSKNKNKLIEDIIGYFKKDTENPLEDDLMNEVLNYIKNMYSYLSISDHDILKKALEKKMRNEFDGQINNIFVEDCTAHIDLRVKENVFKIDIKNDNIVYMDKVKCLNSELIYLDDPFILDDLSKQILFLREKSRNDISHKEHLREKLLQLDDKQSDIKNIITEIISTDKIKKVVEKMETICPGSVVFENRKLGYKNQESDNILSLKNLSTGLKTFVIVKTLLERGAIGDNATLVLDEPEIHLHPQWQIVFAELIVLLQKEFNLHILLNTHSPYFLEAIEVYSQKHNISEKCKYYLAENTGDGQAEILDVTDNIKLIYKKLAEPFQTLVDIAYDNNQLV